MKIDSNKTLTTRLILPLVLDKGFSHLLNSLNYGFVDAFLGDINKPYYNDHVLLLYKSIDNIINYNTRHTGLITLPNFHSWYSYKYNDEYYEVYVLTKELFGSNAKNNIKYLMNGESYNLDYHSKMNILNYWGRTIHSIEHNMLFNYDINDLDNVYTESIRKNIQNDILREVDPPGNIMFMVDQKVEEQL